MEKALQAKFNLVGSKKVNIDRKEAFEKLRVYAAITRKYYKSA